MNLKIGYSDSADRLWIRAGADSNSWWITRRLALPWLSRWAERFESAPPVKLEQWLGGGKTFSIALEHALAREDMEAAAQAATEAAAPVLPVASHILAGVIHIRREGERTCLTLRGDRQRLVLNLSRIESHRLMDALLRQIRRAGWLVSPELPDWLVNPEEGS